MIIMVLAFNKDITCKALSTLRALRVKHNKYQLLLVQGKEENGKEERRDEKGAQGRRGGKREERASTFSFSWPNAEIETYFSTQRPGRHTTLTVKGWRNYPERLYKYKWQCRKVVLGSNRSTVQGKQREQF